MKRISIHVIEMQKRLIAYYVQLSAHKFDSLDETEKFFERHKFPKLTQA